MQPGGKITFADLDLLQIADSPERVRDLVMDSIKSIFRISGKRTLSQITPYDFVLLLIISEVVQQAMIANGNSMVKEVLLVLTLVGMDIGISHLKQPSEILTMWLDSAPIILVNNGRPMKECMEKERVNETEILQRARELQGLERLDQIKYAILENSGGITIVPKEEAK
ncbi:MAG TPA: YetF domain-containing protein [Anaerolineaceae bacterium]|nr:YetF domain-containing protein [Anaerolineaceae bacterium]